MKTESKFKVGQQITYDDGRIGHVGICATVIAVFSDLMLVQFDDRMDTTSIRFSDKAWMQYIS